MEGHTAHSLGMSCIGVRLSGLLVAGLSHIYEDYDDLYDVIVLRFNAIKLLGLLG